MKTKFLLPVFSLAFVSCNSGNTAEHSTAVKPIVGTWQLISNKIITKGDTVTTFPVKGKDEVMIKMYNDTHFSFFRHDRKQGRGSDAVYDTGAGTYELKGIDYAEHLQYCNYREWENHHFSFKLKIQNDTLIQSGIEKIDSLKIDREILEIYVRVK